MSKVHDTVIDVINDEIVKNKSLSPTEAIDVLEYVRDHVESWIDAIQNDEDRTEKGII